MSSSGTPESGIITSVATTITIGSVPTNSLASSIPSNEVCESGGAISHAIEPQNSLIGTASDQQNTFRPTVLTSGHHHGISHDSHPIVKITTFQEQQILPPPQGSPGPHASLPRHIGGYHHTRRPSNR